MIITNRTHPLVKELRLLRDQPNGRRIFLEGPRLIEEALASAIPIELLVISPQLKKTELRTRAEKVAQKIFTVSPNVFDAFSDVEAPQGILAIGQHPRWTWENLFAKRPAPILILDGLQNPGNVASILRTAEAAGASGVLTTPGTAHLFSPKALRGAAGSALRLPSFEHQTIEEIVTHLAENGYTLLGATRETSISASYTSIDWRLPYAVLLGQEGAGISKPWEPHLAKTVTIPMEKPVESLNVAAAAAILLFEARRVRN